MTLFWTIFIENQINYKICAYEVQTRLNMEKKNTFQMYYQRLKKVLVEV